VEGTNGYPSSSAVNTNFWKIAPSNPLTTRVSLTFSLFTVYSGDNLKIWQCPNATSCPNPATAAVWKSYTYLNNAAIIPSIITDANYMQCTSSGPLWPAAPAEWGGRRRTGAT
jgi:hypothetical protein